MRSRPTREQWLRVQLQKRWVGHDKSYNIYKPTRCRMAAPGGCAVMVGG